MGRRAAPVGDRGKLTGMLRRGPNRTVGSRFSWASVLLVAVSLLASACSSASATPAKNQPDGAMLDRALHAWTLFPVGSSPRPLILLKGFVLNPEYGFRDDNSKEAFINGEVTAPASWPVSPTSSMGFPIIGAASAFKTLTTPTTNSLGTPLPLGTTGVQLGSGLFLTDRGWRVLPAWLFSLTGVQNPAKVLAVGPSAIYSAPVTRGGDSPAQISVAVGAGGRHIVANFVGAAAGTGPCTASYALSVKESKQAVAVAVVSHPHAQTATRKRQRQTYVACSSVGYLRHASAELEAPLGERVVVDAKSEGAASATPAPAHRARGDRS